MKIKTRGEMPKPGAPPNRVANFLNFPLPLYFVVSVIFLCCVTALGFGYLVQRTEREGANKVFLGREVRSLAAFPGLVLDAERTMQTEMKGINPQIVGIYGPPDPSRFGKIATASGIPVINGAGLYATPAAQRGWRVITGYFGIGTERDSAALLLDENMRVVHLWRLHENDVVHPEKRGHLFTFPHGFDILPDGSLVYSFDGGVSLKRVDIHGNTLWQKTGRYHHAITLSEDGKTLWALRHAVGENKPREFNAMKNRYLDQLDTATGKTLQSISLEDIAQANPRLTILRTIPLRAYDPTYDPYHENDVDPLPPSLAAQFPQFAAGDLLVSVRNANLVFVLDPATRLVKWWRMGLVDHQHDPDWLPNGLMSVFDNSTKANSSRIITIDPKNMAAETTVPGEEYDFYTLARGKHQVLPDGSVLVTSSGQGRIFEVAPTGEVVFELVNFIEGSPGKVLQLSEAKWLPVDYFTPEAMAVFEAQR